MTDLGYKYEKSEAPVSVGEDNKTHYPSVHLSKNVPEDLMGKEVGGMCRIEIVAKIMSKGIDEHEESKGKKNNMSLDIHKMRLIGPAGKATSEEYNKKTKEEKEAYDKEDLKIEDEDE